MIDLKKHFITSTRAWHEGEVFVFEQQVNGSAVESATLHITALGVYEAEINGQKVGDALFAPGYTYYPRHLNYQTYDVADMLGTGQNSLRVYLGQGWYCGRFTFDNKTQIYGDQVAVSWLLSIKYSDGSVKEYTSHEEVTQLPSPYIYAAFYDGEIYNEVTNAHEDSPVKFTGKLPEVLEQRAVMVKLHEEIPVKTVTKRGDVTILDFGQNFAGIVEIDPGKMQGDSLKLRHGEILNEDGSLYTANLRKAKAELIYHKGSEGKKYRPRFTYMGFRYAELSGTSYSDGLITAYAIYDDMERTGQFKSGEPLVQKLYDNLVWGQKSNYVEVPTDCPQRDERMGYTGDGHVFALTGSYNFDTEAFWEKFLKDIRFSQMDNSEGYVPSTVPALGPAGVGFLSMLGWGNAVTILPEMLYWQYGSSKHLQTQYDSMRTFVEMEIRKMGSKNLWISPNLGDWLMMGKKMAYMAMHNGPVSNSFIVNDLRIMTDTARSMGKSDDAERYGEQLNKTRDAYIKKYVKKDGRMKDDYQGAYIMALKHVLPKEELYNKVFGHLVDKVRKDGIQTGFFATQHILPLLADGGEAKLAYDILLQDGCPGWMYQIKRGATTIWERWDALMPNGQVNESKMSADNMVSFNHYAFGSVGEFYYRYILGISPAEPGYQKIEIRPYVDSRLGKVSGSYKSRRGTICVSWEIEGIFVNVAVETPAEARLCLPDGTIHNVSPGKYSYTCRT